MQEDPFTTPPMSGNVPYKDLEAEVEPVTKDTKQEAISEVDKKTKTLKMYIIGLAVALGFIIIILLVILALLAQKNGSVVVTTPTPTAQATATPAPVLPQELTDRVKALEEDTKNVDLQELNLSYPQLDWDIRF
ncbi:hypothetical protein GYA49_05490 [Candidatus Beckwithbacteria bacterium]|nr:hypothetical protein [Candidatus Beckwithbacteria bacterium]